MSPVTTPVGGELRLPASSLSWEGHDFLGWNTKADRSGTAYADRAIIEPVSNLTLYAQWGPSGYDTITVKFDGCGGTGAPAAMTMSTSSTGTISADVPTKDGFAFVGWNTSADGSGIQVLSGEGVGLFLNALGASDVDNGVVTLYAQWAPAAATHTISFDENGGQGSMDTQKVADGGSTRLRLSSFERPGYTFRC